MQRMRYVICDVFTNKALTGNPLAVFTDARGVSAEKMQSLARELNLSETTFLLPAENGGDARVRIFTPTRELPFAGHPTLGTAFVLAAPLQRPMVRLETGAGIVPVRFEMSGAQVSFAWMLQPMPRCEAFTSDDIPMLLDALSVRASALPVEIYDNGVRHVYVMLESQDAVAAVRPNLEKLLSFGAIGINVFAGAGKQWKTRMFGPGLGVSEDPATGSAAGPLAVHLLKHGLVNSGEEIVIEQGAELLRPSFIHAKVTGTFENLEAVEVGGSVVIVARGEFHC
jgi:trans-2,3-dihydro-3-hydroxyanthranilate isomerase